MQNFSSKRTTKQSRQINNAPPHKVFPLLCPVREKDWIDGWKYDMIYSGSGLAEQGCVFTTPADDKTTTWYITSHDPQKFIVEFVRVTTADMVVKININLSADSNGNTIADIRYEYTSMNEEASRWIDEKCDTEFNRNMIYWENAINHYLQTGQKLLKS